MRKMLLCLVALGLFGSSSGAWAQLSLNLLPAAQSGNAGDTLTYFGTIQNLGTSDVFVNSDNFALTGAGLTLDDARFFNLTPLIVPGGTTTGPLALFDIAINPSASPGNYLGAFSLLGGSDASGQNILANQSFQVTVTPEPGAAAWLSGLSFTSLIWARRRAERRRKPFTRRAENRPNAG